MIKKRCRDCKHTRGIGFDFWCGEKHTKYESLGVTNCPYFEYHDWSKGTPSDVKKQVDDDEEFFEDYFKAFAKSFDKEFIEKTVEKGFVIPDGKRIIRNTETGEEAIFYDVEDGLLLEKWLNALHEENQQLRNKVDMLERIIDGDLE